MAKSTFISSTLLAPTVSTTIFSPVSGCLRADPTEINVKTKIYDAGTLSNLYIYVRDNTCTNTSTLRLRKNGANGNQTVSIGAGVTGLLEDVTNSDSVVSGDYIDYSLAWGDGASSIVTVMSNLFDSTGGDKISRCVSASSANITAASTTEYWQCNGSVSKSFSAADRQYMIPKASTLEHMSAYISANARGTATTFYSYINAGDGNQTFSVGASTTGYFEDASNTDSLSDDDLFCMKTVSGTGTGTLTVSNNSSQLRNTNNYSFFMNAESGFISPNAIYYMIIAGRNVFSATIVPNYIKTGFDCEFQIFNMYVTTNGMTSDSTVVYQINTVSQSPVITITGGVANSWFSSTGGNTSVSATDTVNYKLVAGATGSLLLSNRMMLAIYEARFAHSFGIIF